MGALGSQRLFNMCIINDIDWAYFTFGGNIPYSSLCIVFFFPTLFLLPVFEPCHFFLDFLQDEL